MPDGFELPIGADGRCGGILNYLQKCSLLFGKCSEAQSGFRRSISKHSSFEVLVSLSIAAPHPSITVQYKGPI
jgi:hypothetical protein